MKTKTALLKNYTMVNQMFKELLSLISQLECIFRLGKNMSHVMSQDNLTP